MKQNSIEDILATLKELGHPDKLASMARVGITPEKAYGVKIPDLRNLAKMIGCDHDFALQLWEVDLRETRILASMIADPGRTDSDLIDAWTAVFDYWEICDQCCMNLFEKTPFAVDKAFEYSSSEIEFVKRTGFVLMARLAVCDKKADDNLFLSFLPVIRREAADSRNMVKKAVNWALRQIGKRNIQLNKQALQTAVSISFLNSKTARWVAADAIKELESEAVRKRLGIISK